MNVSIFINHYYLSVWSDQEEAQLKNATLPDGTINDPPRSESYINQRNLNLIIFVSTGLCQRKNITSKTSLF